MLTQNDLNAFEKLIDKKTKGQTPRLDSFEIRSTLRDIEKRLAALESTIINKADLKNFAMKSDLKNFATKDDLKEFVTKKDLNKNISSLGDRIIKRFDQLNDFLDGEVIDLKKRVDKIENHLRLSPLSS